MSDDELLAALFTNRERAELFEALDNGQLYVATLRDKGTDAPRGFSTGERHSTFGQRKRREGSRWRQRVRA